jgi:hypothetical protein
MFQEVDQTRDEKVAMYMKLTKRELVEMLVNWCEAGEKSLPPPISIVPNPGTDGTVTLGPPPTIWGPWAPCG